MGTAETVQQLHEAFVTFDDDLGQVLRIQRAAHKNL